MNPYAPPGLNRTLERGFQRFPLGCPLSLIVVGGVLLVVAFAGSGTGWVAMVPIIVFGAGLIALPFGIVTTLRRRLHPIVLQCPQCGAVSRESATPFTVQRWPEVPYAYVTCSQCGKDFTASKFARLR